MISKVLFSRISKYLIELTKIVEISQISSISSSGNLSTYFD